MKKEMLIWILGACIASVLATNEVCPGGSFSCPDTATCCQLADKSYGCCPLKNGVCCDDHIHCCPEKSKCQAGICIQLDGMNFTAKKLPSKGDTRYCFHSNFTCPEAFTCCKDQKQGYACCPLTHGVCCNDHQTCCPHGTVCDVKQKRCVGKGFIAEMYDSQKTRNLTQNFEKFVSVTKSNNVTSVFCPGSSFQCPNGYTCCQLPSGDWGCCPFVKATCCADHLHCCPENMKCDSSSQTCSQGLVSISSAPKKLSVPIAVHTTCPDNSTCAESMTCCELSNLHYGCCPYRDAVCCEDYSHCCPNGYICDVVDKNCVPKEKWFTNNLSKYYKKLG